MLLLLTAVYRRTTPSIYPRKEIIGYYVFMSEELDLEVYFSSIKTIINYGIPGVGRYVLYKFSALSLEYLR